MPCELQVEIGIDPEEVFADADWALLIGAKPRGPGMERADLLDMNGQIFVGQVQRTALLSTLLPYPHLQTVSMCLPSARGS